MGSIIERVTEVLKGQRAKIILAVGGGAAIAIGACALVITILLPSRGALPDDISVGTYSAAAVADLEQTSTFSKSVLSTEHNRKLNKGPYIIDNNEDYQKFLKDYDNITVVEPEQVPLVDDWFQAGYYALVCTTDKYGCPVNLYATMWCSDDAGNIKVVMAEEPLDEQFQYSEDPSKCVQSSAVVFLPQDVLLQAKSIEVLF